MTPRLVLPPTQTPWDLTTLRTYLRVNHPIEDGIISQLAASATGLLDGWTGDLGRAIMSQTWMVRAEVAGAVILPMPDVTDVTVDYGQGGIPAPARICGGRWVVDVDAPADIEFACQMGPQQLEMVRAAIMMIVGHWYENREAAGATQTLSDTTFSARALIDRLRWRVL